MNPDLVTGIAGVLIGGILNGSFVAPMKRMKGWEWENTWFVYSISGLLIIPWIAAFYAVPGLTGVLSAAPSAAIWKVILFGIGWGIGSVLFGLGVARLGLAVGYGLILGLIAPIGTFLPLAVLYPERLATRQGIALAIGTAIVLGGIVFCGAAAKIRENAAGGPRTKAEGFGVGLIICILAGLFSPMLNFAFVFGKELQDLAAAAGAGPNGAGNAIWCLTLTAGCLMNAGYAAYLLSKNDRWKLFRGAPAAYWIWGSLMGLLCFGSFMVYGAGATALGSLGGIVGWPLFMSMALITSNSLGAMTGEWAGAPKKAWGYSMAGIGLLIVAITVIGAGGQG